MTNRKADLGELETLVMLAILRLRGEASARRIREEIAERGGAIMLLSGLLATLGPARRALRIQPMEALREE